MTRPTPSTPLVPPGRATALLASALLAAAPAQASDADWRMGGQNLSNTRHQAAERHITPHRVATLAPRWVLDTDGDVSATPAVVGGQVYVPDWAGKLYRIDARSGQVRWKVTLPAVSRATPTVAGDRLIVPLLRLPDGTPCAGQLPAGACVLAIDRHSGATLWQSRIDAQPLAYVTQSPVVHAGRVYVGITSAEETLAGLQPGYPCCSFRGAVTALDLRTGAPVWKTHTVPDGAGRPPGDRYSGGGVWGSTPVVDAARGMLYVGTGNNYGVPQAVKTCFALFGAPSCETAADNHADSILALDLGTGAIRWARSFRGTDALAWEAALIGYDAWNLSCVAFLFGGSTANCPSPAGPDYDFAQGPMLYRTRGPGSRELLAVGQKSGVMRALDPDDGRVVWATVTGPGGLAGGLQWGSATDGDAIYFANSNSDMKPVTINGQLGFGGFWGAIDAATGNLRWRTADPNPLSGAYGAVTVANGVVFAGSIGGPSPFTTIPGQHRTAPTMFAFDAASGAVRWTYVAGGSVVGGAAVVDGWVYWGSGYSSFGVGVDNRKLFAFALPGAPDR
ncbi:MAG: PQQ-binding-like beta-propeller repeat protein [Rubrivivax sp.]